MGSIKNTTEEVTETDDERKSRETSGSSSAVGSVKNTTEEVTEVSSGRKGSGRALECPLTPTPPLMAASTQSRLVWAEKEFARR